MFDNLRAWYLVLKLLISLSNKLGMVYTIILLSLIGFRMTLSCSSRNHKSMEINKHIKPRSWYLLPVLHVY